MFKIVRTDHLKGLQDYIEELEHKINCLEDDLAALEFFRDDDGNPLSNTEGLIRMLQRSSE